MFPCLIQQRQWTLLVHRSTTLPSLAAWLLCTTIAHGIRSGFRGQTVKLNGVSGPFDCSFGPYMNWNFGRSSGEGKCTAYFDITSDVGGPVRRDGGHHVSWKSSVHTNGYIAGEHGRYIGFRSKAPFSAGNGKGTQATTCPYGVLGMRPRNRPHMGF